MTIQKIHSRFSTLMLFIIALASMRVLNTYSHLSVLFNFTPIGAISLFGGVYFSSAWKRIVFPLFTLVLSDIIIQTIIFKGKYGIFYEGCYIMYAAFILFSFIGKWIINKVDIPHVAIASFIIALLQWWIGDTMTWTFGGIDIRTGSLLSKDWAGLQQALIQGFPFFLHFLLSTLIYSTIAFGVFEWMKKIKPSFALRIV